MAWEEARTCVSAAVGRRRLSKTHLVEDVLEALLRQCRALDVLDGTELPGHSLAVLPLDRGHSLLRQLVLDCVVFPQIHLCADD